MSSSMSDPSPTHPPAAPESAAPATETDERTPAKAPRLRRATTADLRAALAAGWRDFRAAPAFGLFFGGVYALGGLLILALLTVLDQPAMIIPLAVGFPLIGPFVAIGLYEVSRRLSRGEPLVWREILGVILAARKRPLAWMGFVLLFIFWIWAYQVRILLAIFVGYRSVSTIDGFLDFALGTSQGLNFLLVGTLIGAFLAVVLYATTVLSMPLLVDRDVDFITAMIVSVSAVRENAGVMLLWAAVIAGVLLLALAPLFVGLVIALPVLGHATWRLYESLIEPEPPAAGAPA